MNSKKYQAALFDMDGLLLDSESVYTNVTQHIVSEWGKTFDWEVKQHMIGRASIDSARFLVKTLDLPITGEEYLERRDPMLEEGFKSVPALLGAEALIRELHSKNIPISVATSSSRFFFDLKTAPHDWFSLFNAVVTSSHPEVKNAKPAPDIFLTAAKTLGMDPSDCLVFEDAPSGLTAAHAAGAGCVCVPDVMMPKAPYSNAELVISNLTEFNASEWF